MTRLFLLEAILREFRFSTISVLSPILITKRHRFFISRLRHFLIVTNSGYKPAKSQIKTIWNFTWNRIWANLGLLSFYYIMDIQSFLFLELSFLACSNLLTIVLLFCKHVIDCKNNCHTIMLHFLSYEYQHLYGMTVGMMDGFSTIIPSWMALIRAFWGKDLTSFC